MRRKINENGITISHIQNKDAVCMQVRPDIFWKNVTIIGKSAFTGDRIEEIIIPYGVQKIGDEAFSYCRNGIMSVHISSSVTHIGQKAFDGCKNIKSFSMSMNTSIMDNTFENSSIQQVVDAINDGVIFKNVTIGSFAMAATENATFVYGFSGADADYMPITIKKVIKKIH